ncbi:MAG: asparaginase [Candidatus Aenigmarchaeota archaeon]|nr:asparaginase [Candidatus Aenigmarchaeota archaeon]
MSPSKHKIDDLVYLGTGGTISSGKSEKGLAPKYSLEEMVAEIYPEIRDYVNNVHPIQLMNIDSSEMTHENRIELAEKLYESLLGKYNTNPDRKARVVITHGTDTLGYTAPLLSFMVQGVGVPVVLTGAQRDWEHPHTDAKRNLLFASLVASEDIGGIYVAFKNTVIRGTRVRKNEAPEIDDLNPFESAHIEPDGYLRPGFSFEFSEYAEDNYGESRSPVLDTKILPGSVKVIKLLPEHDHKEFNHIIDDGYKGVIIEAFGTGNMPSNNGNSLIPVIQDLIHRGVTVAVGTQTGGTVDMHQYASARPFLDIGAVPLFDTTTEAAYSKLMWILGHTDRPSEVRKRLLRNYAGEIDKKNIGGRTKYIKQGLILSDIAQSILGGGYGGLEHARR